MTLVQGCVAIAIGNIALLIGLGRWNGELHWVIGSVAMLFLVVSWVLYWADDLRAAPEGAERE
ncbi:MAG: hypothetical protein JSS56_04960 [Proteobacteria bacterium]|nr:hypothetical protein [Pseudomonadota bacterium]